MITSEPFDRQARRAQRSRSAPNFGAHGFLKHWMLAEIVDRLSELSAPPGRLLDLACHGLALGPRLGSAWTVALDPAPAFAAMAPSPAIVADEDRLPFADASFDHIVSAGSLQGVNDLPGALIQLRRVLRPGGQLLALFPGGETLRELRQDLISAEVELTGRAAARIMPMVDAASAPALLQRAGFVSAVSEVESLTLRHAGLLALLADLHGMGEGNYMRERVPLRRDVLAAAAAAFAARADADGKTATTIQVLTVTAWAP